MNEQMSDLIAKFEPINNESGLCRDCSYNNSNFIKSVYIKTGKSFKGYFQNGAIEDSVRRY